MPRLPGRRPGSRAVQHDAESRTTTAYQAHSTPAAAASSDTPTGRERVGRQASTLPAPRRERVVERRALIAIVAIVAGIAGAAAISRSMSDVIEARAEVADARALNESMQGKVEAGRREIEFAQQDAYLRFASRGFGYGRGRERAFALREGAGPPPSITPLGGDAEPPHDDVLASFLDVLLEP
jgi:hypothetical protein